MQYNGLPPLGQLMRLYACDGEYGRTNVGKERLNRDLKYEGLDFFLLTQEFVSLDPTVAVDVFVFPQL